MKNKLYYRELHCWVEHETEVYLQIRRMRHRTYSKRYKAGECFCKYKQLWLCDGICDGCEFYKGTDELYFSGLIQSDKKTEDVTIQDSLDDDGRNEKLCMDTLIYGEIIERLSALMPELIEYGQLKIEGKTDEEIANTWGLSRTAIYKRIKKVKQVLEVEFEGIFKKN